MKLIAPEIGIDLGSSNTRVYVRGRGVVLNEPSLLLVNQDKNREIEAVGIDAYRQSGSIGERHTLIRPIVHGAVKDFDMAATLLRALIRKTIGVSHLVRPNMVISIPGNLSAVEKRVLKDVAYHAGARKNGVYFISKAFASAFGAGLPVIEPKGSFVVDVGGGTTEAALVSYSGLVAERSRRFGGIKMDTDIIDMLQKEHRIHVGDRIAEEIKQAMGSVIPFKQERTQSVRGRDSISRLTNVVDVTTAQVYQAIQPTVQSIVQTVGEVLRSAPPEIAGDVVEQGICLTGGTAKLFGFEKVLKDAFRLPVHIPQEPGLSAIFGLGHIVENFEQITNLLVLDTSMDEV